LVAKVAAPRLLEDFPKAQQEPSLLIDYVDARSRQNTDIIQIVARHPDPAVARRLADVWAESYERVINSLYTQTFSPAEVAALVEPAQREYETAQADLVASGLPSQLSELKRKLTTAQQNLEFALQTRVRLEQLLPEVVALREQVAHSGNLLDDYIPVLNQLRARAFAASAMGDRGTSPSVAVTAAPGTGSAAQTPVIVPQVDIQLGARPVRPLTTPQLLDDIDTLIATVSSRLNATGADEPPIDLTDPAAREQLINRQLSPRHVAQMQAQVAELERDVMRVSEQADTIIARRDLAKETYRTLAQKLAEKSVAETSGTLVRFAGGAPEARPAPTGAPLVLSFALAGVIGLAIGLLAAGLLELVPYLRGYGTAHKPLVTASSSGTLRDG
jgi:hypothetical protein